MNLPLWIIFRIEHVPQAVSLSYLYFSPADLILRLILSCEFTSVDNIKNLPCSYTVIVYCAAMIACSVSGAVNSNT